MVPILYFFKHMHLYNPLKQPTYNTKNIHNSIETYSLVHIGLLITDLFPFKFLFHFQRTWRSSRSLDNNGNERGITCVWQIKIKRIVDVQIAPNHERDVTRVYDIQQLILLHFATGLLHHRFVSQPFPVGKLLRTDCIGGRSVDGFAKCNRGERGRAAFLLWIIDVNVMDLNGAAQIHTPFHFLCTRSEAAPPFFFSPHTDPSLEHRVHQRRN